MWARAGERGGDRPGDLLPLFFHLKNSLSMNSNLGDGTSPVATGPGQPLSGGVPAPAVPCGGRRLRCGGFRPVCRLLDPALRATVISLIYPPKIKAVKERFSPTPPFWSSQLRNAQSKVTEPGLGPVWAPQRVFGPAVKAEVGFPGSRSVFLSHQRLLGVRWAAEATLRWQAPVPPGQDWRGAGLEGPGLPAPTPGGAVDAPSPAFEQTVALAPPCCGGPGLRVARGKPGRSTQGHQRPGAPGPAGGRNAQQLWSPRATGSRRPAEP